MSNDIDQAVRDIFDACDCENDMVDISARHDQWWGVLARCPRVTVRGVSNTVSDPSTAFVQCRDRFVALHGLPDKPTG